MNISDLVSVYKSIVKQYEVQQNKYEIDDYSKGVVSTYRHVIVDLEEYLKNYEND